MIIKFWISTKCKNLLNRWVNVGVQNGALCYGVIEKETVEMIILYRRV
jgi:hypothetical protein